MIIEKDTSRDRLKNKICFARFMTKLLYLMIVQLYVQSFWLYIDWLRRVYLVLCFVQIFQHSVDLS